MEGKHSTGDSSRVFRKLSVGTETPHSASTAGGAAAVESKLSRSSSGRNLHALAGNANTGAAGTGGFNPVRSVRDVSIRRNASALNPSSGAAFAYGQRSRASSLLSDVRIGGAVSPPTAQVHVHHVPLHSVKIRSEKSCRKGKIEFQPQIVVKPEGVVETGFNPPESRRPVVVLFDSNERFLKLSAKVIARRLSEESCLIFSTQSSVILSVCGSDGGGGSAAATAAAARGVDAAVSDGSQDGTVFVMWKKNGILQQSVIPARPGLASCAACVVIKNGVQSSSTDLSPRRSLDVKSGDFLLGALARNSIRIPTIVCVRDAVREMVQHSVKTTGKLFDSENGEVTIVTAVLGQTSMARALETQLQKCCPWALIPVESSTDGTDKDSNNTEDHSPGAVTSEKSE